MSKAPVCHISTDQKFFDQPKPTLLPSIPVAVDLPSAIQAINIIKLLLQMLAGQQAVTGPNGGGGVPGLRPGSSPPTDQKGQSEEKTGRYIEDRPQRVEQTVRVFQNNDKSSPNWVDVKRINRAVWKDTVTGERIVWVR